MSLIYDDTPIDVVKLTLTKKDGSGTSTYYLGTDYYAEGDIYTSSPEVWPVLAGTPIAELGFSRITNVMADRANPSFSVYAHTPLDTVGNTIYNLQTTHYLEEASVEYYWYSKPRRGTTSAHSTTNVWQSRMKIVSVQFEGASDGGGDTTTITCRDEWFKNKRIGRRLMATDFNSLEEGYDGEFGAIPIGNNVIIPAPWLSCDTSTSPVTGTIFTGWRDLDFPVSAINTWWVQSQNRSVDPTEWLEFEFVGNKDIPWSGVAGPYSGYTNFSLVDYSRALVDSPLTKAKAIHLVECYISPAGTVTGALGALTMTAYNALYLGDTGTFEPIGSPLQVVAKDPEAATIQAGTDRCGFQFRGPVIVNQNLATMFLVDWTGEDGTNYLRTRVASSGNSHYYRDKSTNNPPFQREDDNTLAMAVYALGYGDGFQNSKFTTQNVWRYSRFHVAAKGALLHTGETRARLDTDIKLRVDVNGLKDSVGTYTGSAGEVISNPADVLQLVLMNSELFLGVSSSDVDTTSFTAVRTAADAVANVVSYPIYSVYGQDFIRQVCEQFLLHFHKKRDGDLALTWLTTPGPASNTLSEAELRGNLTVLDYYGGSPDDVLNAFNVEFTPNRLDANLISTTDTIGLGKYEERTYLSDAENDSFPAPLDTLVATSTTRFGERELGLTQFDMHETAASVKGTITRYAQLHHEPPKTVTVRLPRKDWQSIAIFDSFNVLSFDLPCPGGTSDSVKLHEAGSAVTVYNQGVPMHVVTQGQLTGRVINIAATGPMLDLDISTTGAI